MTHAIVQAKIGEARVSTFPLEGLEAEIIGRGAFIFKLALDQGVGLAQVIGAALEGV